MEDTYELTVGLLKTVVRGSKQDQVKLLQHNVWEKDEVGEVLAKEFATLRLSLTVGETTLISREAIHTPATRETNQGEEHAVEGMN